MTAFTTAEDLAARAYDLLVASTSKPLGLTTDKILDYPLTPSDSTNLPLVAVYLTAGEVPIDPEEGSQIGAGCIATITIDIRCIADHPVRGTRPFREWVLATLFPQEDPNVAPNDTLGSLAFKTIYQGFKPYGDVKDDWEAGAYLTFDAHYFFGI